MPGDVSLYWAINNLAQKTAWLHTFAAGYALWGGLVVLALLLIVGWWTARQRSDPPVAVATAVLTGIATVVAVLVNQWLLAPAFVRPRPCLVFRHAEVLLRCGSDYSMPSDHCIIAGAFVAGLWLLHRGFGAMAVVAAIGLAFARVYVGVHYPLDTIACLVAGALLGLLVVFGLRRRATIVASALMATRLRLLVTDLPHPNTSPR